MSDEPQVLSESAAAKFSRVMQDPELKSFIEPLLKDMDSDGDGKPDIKGVKNLWTKDGQTSTTKLFANLANVIVLVVSTLCVMFGGAVVELGFLHFTVPGFNAEWAALILGLFQANNHVDTRLKAISAKESV